MRQQHQHVVQGGLLSGRNVREYVRGWQVLSVLFDEFLNGFVELEFIRNQLLVLSQTCDLLLGQEQLLEFAVYLLVLVDLREGIAELDHEFLPRLLVFEHTKNLAGSSLEVLFFEQLLNAGFSGWQLFIVVFIAIIAIVVNLWFLVWHLFSDIR